MNKTQTTAPTYALVGLKTFNGMEGGGFEATLTRDGVKIARVCNGGTGGPVEFQWLDYAATPIPTTFRDWRGDMKQRPMTPEESRLTTYALTLPPETHDVPMTATETKPFTVYADPESVVNDLVDVAATEKQVRALMSRAVMFLKPGSPSVWSIKTKNAAHRDAVIARFPVTHAGCRVLNTAPVSDVVAVLTAAGQLV